MRRGEETRQTKSLLAKYRALLTERDHLGADATREAHDLLAALPAGDVRDKALQGEATAIARNRQIRTALSQSQSANADAVQALLDWSEAHRRDLQVRNGKLMTANQQELDEVRALSTHLVDSERVVDAAIKQAKSVESNAVQQLQQAHRDIDQ